MSTATSQMAINTLQTSYNCYLEHWELPPWSADELLSDLDEVAKFPRDQPWSAEDYQGIETYLRAFILVWDETQAMGVKR